MKPSRLNKVIGLSLGEQSLLAAEVVAVADGRPAVRQLAEFRYPDGVTPAQPAALGAALAEFLREQKFTARHAVVGLPARWLIVKPKQVPPADPATLADLLRLQAEGEFSSELKDLVYDYAADATAGHPTSVLLIATPQRYVDGATAMCEAARLTATAVTPSAVALGAATAGGADGTDGATPIVMAVGPGGAELTSQAGAAPSAIRYLRGPAAAGGDNRPFLGELRRTVSSLPVLAGDRQMVLWGSPADAAAVGDGLGMPVRAADLSALGVTTGDGSANGDGRRYAAAVALALSAVGGNRRAVDFLHPRLAAPKPRRVPLWAIWTAVGVAAAVALCVLAYQHLQASQATLDHLNQQLARTDDAYKSATDFVDKVTLAKRWHGGDPRYLACLNDLSLALPDDRQTYVTSLSLHEPPRPTGTGATAKAARARANNDPTLIGRLEAKTGDQDRVQEVVDRLKARPSLVLVKLQNTQTGGGRDPQVSFTITFDYVPPKRPTTATTPPSTPARK